MGKLCRITNGTTYINFIAAAAADWHIEPGGVSQSALTDAHLVGDDPVAGKTMVVTYRLAGTADDHDALKDKVSALIALIRQAAQYQRTNWQLSPVWIEEQGRTETNPRYAMVLRAMELDRMSVMLKPFDLIHYIINFGLTFELEFPWRPTRPASLPTALTLTASDGPANDVAVHLANFRDEVAITHFKEKDAAAYADIAAGGRLFPAVVAQDDAIMWGSTDQPIKHIVMPKLGTAGDLTDTTLVLSYSDGVGSFAALVLGTDYTCYPGSTLEECLEQNDEDIVISVNPPSDHVTDTYGAALCFWLKLAETHALPVYATNPVSHAAYDPYAQSKNYFEVAAAQLKGDHPIRSLIRLRCPAGGGADAGLGTPSRFIMGARSLHLGADEFEPWLNAGNEDNPAGWAVTYDADTSSVARTNAPGGYEAQTTFATVTSMLPRCIYTGNNKLAFYRGKFEVFVLYYQTSGDDGDIDIKASFIIGSDATTSPQRDTDTVGSLVGARWTVASLGEMRLPFGEITGADELTESLIIKLSAELLTAGPDIYWGGVFLCPLDEWSGGLDDPLTNTTYGPSALRGATSIDFDNGVLARRAQKFLVQSDGDLIPGENWNYSGSLPSIEPSRQTRIYVLQLRYDTDWGVAPLIAEPGMHMVAEVFTHPGYVLLRGDD